MPPDECRSEGTPSLGEGPDVRGEPFFAYFFLAFEKKVRRRKGATLSSRYRSNGYTPKTKSIKRCIPMRSMGILNDPGLALNTPIPPRIPRRALFVDLIPINRNRGLQVFLHRLNLAASFIGSRGIRVGRNLVAIL